MTIHTSLYAGSFALVRVFREGTLQEVTRPGDTDLEILAQVRGFESYPQPATAPSMVDFVSVTLKDLR